MQKIAFICTVFSENSNLHTTNTLYDKQLAIQKISVNSGSPGHMEGGSNMAFRKTNRLQHFPHSAAVTYCPGTVKVSCR